MSASTLLKSWSKTGLYRQTKELKYGVFLPCHATNTQGNKIVWTNLYLRFLEVAPGFDHTFQTPTLFIKIFQKDLQSIIMIIHYSKVVVNFNTSIGKQFMIKKKMWGIWMWGTWMTRFIINSTKNCHFCLFGDNIFFFANLST